MSRPSRLAARNGIGVRRCGSSGCSRAEADDDDDAVGLTLQHVLVQQEKHFAVNLGGQGKHGRERSGRTATPPAGAPPLLFLFSLLFFFLLLCTFSFAKASLYFPRFIDSSRRPTPATSSWSI